MDLNGVITVTLTNPRGLFVIIHRKVNKSFEFIGLTLMQTRTPETDKSNNER